jgi:ABC-type bacteriocin/lantibiotic exporter with double-glycine peptidase domain
MDSVAGGLEVPYFKQDTNYTCGPTALQMVMAYYGIRESERGLAKTLHTSAVTGTGLRYMLEVSRQHGLYAYVNNDSSLEEIAYLITAFKVPCIIRYLETDDDEDHYAVVVDVSNGEITLHDPWHGPSTHITIGDFEKRWTCDHLGTCSRWLIAITPEPLPMGRQYRPTNPTHG